MKSSVASKVGKWVELAIKVTKLVTELVQLYHSLS